MISTMTHGACRSSVNTGRRRNGTHYRRDVTWGEDACRTAHWQGAAVLASLRNLAIGVYELERERERTAVDTLKSWCQQQTFSTVWPILQR
jgi:hypothetical protein